MSEQQRRVGPVDYDAWRKGYMPPSEHVLIDQLAYRGARVIMATDFAEHGAIWIVTRDIRNLKPAARKKLREIINDVLDEQLDENEPPAKPAAEVPADLP